MAIEEGSPATKVQLLDRTLIDSTLAKAHTAPRKRTNFNFHATAEDNPHRFLNAMLRGTYAAPHRHLSPPKCESFLVLRGEVAVFIFNDNGSVLHIHRLGRDGLIGVDIPAGVWHSIAPISEEAVCYEVKPGPWDPTTDKEFALWAPKEGEKGAQEYLSQLLQLVDSSE